MTKFSYRLLQSSPQIIIQSPLTALVIAVGHTVFVVYLALAALDCARGLTAAALSYSTAQRYTALGMSREKGYAFAFDTATGRVVAQPLPGSML